MTLPKEWQQEVEKIMSKYQKEAGEQEYYMYYDVDVPKMMAKIVTAYKQAVEKAVNERIGHLEEFIRTVKDMHLNGLITAAKTELLILLDTLQTLKPTSND
jgi:hypothetical protein